MSDDENEGDQGAYAVLFEEEKSPKTYIYKNGKANATFANQDTYAGEYKGGSRDGEGTYTWSKAEGNTVAGAKYVGDYKDGKRHGIGVFTYPDKSKYTGQWNSNMRDGQGTYVYVNGDRYCGTWENDTKKGAGTYLYASSQTQLTGVFDNGKCTDGTWEYYDGKRFICKYQGDSIVQFGNRILAPVAPVVPVA